jgi:hypothetical protein
MIKHAVYFNWPTINRNYDQIKKNQHELMKIIILYIFIKSVLIEIFFKCMMIFFVDITWITVFILDKPCFKSCFG